MSLRISMKIREAKEALGDPAFPSFWNSKKKCVFNKRTIKVCVSCSWRCLRTSTPSTPLPDSFFESPQFWKQHTSRVEGPSKVRGSCWEEQKRKVFPQRGVIICLPGKSIIFNCHPPLHLMACDPPDVDGINTSVLTYPRNLC